MPFQIVPKVAHRPFKGRFTVPLFGTISFQKVERTVCCPLGSYKDYGTVSERF